VDACCGPFFAGRVAVASLGAVSPAFVGVVSGVCTPPDFGMTVFFRLVCGTSTLLSWANADVDNSNIATASLYIVPPWILLWPKPDRIQGGGFPSKQRSPTTVLPVKPSAMIGGYSAGIPRRWIRIFRNSCVKNIWQILSFFYFWQTACHITAKNVSCSLAELPRIYR
jgi:hypothetical protein